MIFIGKTILGTIKGLITLFFKHTEMLEVGNRRPIGLLDFDLQNTH